jgi:hypothetical protein
MSYRGLQPPPLSLDLASADLASGAGAGLAAGRPRPAPSLREPRAAGRDVQREWLAGRDVQREHMLLEASIFCSWISSLFRSKELFADGNRSIAGDNIRSHSPHFPPPSPQQPYHDAFSPAPPPRPRLRAASPLPLCVDPLLHRFRARPPLPCLRSLHHRRGHRHDEAPHGPHPESVRVAPSSSPCRSRAGRHASLHRGREHGRCLWE